MTDSRPEPAKAKKRKLFGPSKNEIWRDLADQLGADYVEEGFCKNAKVQVHVNEWTITLDTYSVHTQHAHMTFTRMRVPYVNADGFRFAVTRKHLFSGIGRIFGAQDVEIGIREFDDAFVIKGNDEYKLKELFRNDRIRELLSAQRDVSFKIHDDEGWFGKQPENVDELQFVASGVVKDIERLKALYELFAEVLNHLCHIGSAYEDDPKFVR